MCFLQKYKRFLFSPPVNVALRGIATQSSNYYNYYASFAIDGNRLTGQGVFLCTHTNADNNPWWRVNLLAMYDISNVIITNRGDAFPERLNGAEIHIGNSLINNGNNNPRCVVISSISAGASVNYTFQYARGVIPCNFKRAFLRIKFNSNDDLSNPAVKDKVLQKVCLCANVHSVV
ncbi:hypothetical protein QTP86_021710, partial [Hemibagrus guttatus]